MISLSVNTNEVKRLLTKYQHDALLDCGKVMRFEMGSIGNSLAKYTPPSKGLFGGDLSDKRIGEQAVEKDLSKLFVPIKKKSRLKIIDQISKSNGDIKVSMTGSESELKLFHTARRKNGRVKFKAREVFKLGKTPLFNKLYAPKTAVNRYIKTVKGHVGKLKAGWMAMIRQFGGKMPASWIQRHAGQGGARDMLSDDFKGFLEGTNRTPYSKIIERKGTDKFVLQMHEKMLTKNIKNVIGNAARYYNAQKATNLQKVKAA